MLEELFLTTGVFNEDKTAVIGRPNAHLSAVLNTGSGTPNERHVLLNVSQKERLQDDMALDLQLVEVDPYILWEVMGPNNNPDAQVRRFTYPPSDEYKVRWNREGVWSPYEGSFKSKEDAFASIRKQCGK
ncbi:MAG TPA: hypothetical protein VK604_02180 [Bryobacteraceae bacterium]|nr:hypothetical protein [Bryobacteraceae bacterium]